jgi:hypothetical protein
MEILVGVIHESPLQIQNIVAAIDLPDAMFGGFTRRDVWRVYPT